MKFVNKVSVNTVQKTEPLSMSDMSSIFDFFILFQQNRVNFIKCNNSWKFLFSKIVSQFEKSRFLQRKL